MRTIAGFVGAVLLAGCASGPPTPDWQMNARGAVERGVAAWMEGNARVETAEFARARTEAARTGQVDVMARIELTRCAARVAALVFENCEAFEKLRADAAPAEHAYAAYLNASVGAGDAALLPPQHRAVAASVAAQGGAGAQALKGIEDPLSRLVAAGVVFRAAQASPEVVQLAVDTASAQGWRRPLLAWLGVQAQLAAKAGDADAAARIQRRIGLVEGR